MPRRRILGEKPSQQRIDGRRNRGNPAVERRDRLVEDGPHRGVHARADERVASREHFIQQNAERENIRSAICWLPADVLRGHVSWSPTKDVLSGRNFSRGLVVDGVVLRQARRQAEVHDFRVAVLGEHHVRRLEIAVNDAPFVRGVERLGDLFRNAQRLADPKRPAPQPSLERLPVDVLHGDARPAVERGDFVNRTDEWVIEGGGGARLAE